MTTTAVDDQHAADPHAITVGAYVRTPNGRSGRVLHIQGETAEVAMPRGDNDTESVVYLMEYLEPMAGCATHERDPALNKSQMLKILARELRVWPEDSTDCAHTEPTGWGWQWMDQAPDCEFVLSAIWRDGREWTISEREWRDARWGAGEERIDRIAQSDASGDHYPPACADGLPCGVAHSPGDDAYCLRCPHEPLDGGAEPVLSERDAINPSHYRAGKVECIDALESATVNKSGIEAVCTANAIKYLWRYESKGGAEDVRKARWYIERLLRALEAGHADDQ